MTTLVTGATGFLGCALVAELIKRQQAVRILARDDQKARQQFGDAVTIIAGDITDAAQVQQAVEGASTIYHLAGRLYHPSTSEELYQQTHIEGTRILLKACQGQAQLRRIVHASTTGVHGITGATPAAEDAPFAPTNVYEATKLAGELLALRAYQKQGLPVTVARPGLVYGPGDLHLLGFFASIKKGLFRVIDGGKALLHPVYIDDLIAALLLCAECPQAIGRSYNIAGERPVSVRELATAIADALDRKLPAGSIPLWLANIASDVFAVMPGMKGERAPLTRSRVQFLTNSRIYDITRANSELGYIPKVGLEEGMKLTASWYYKHHYLDN
ncbi:MAG TPA: NAD-dependent epimerase/dehydratase family protein [Ktedonobacteraceae bacterium]|nr:NAD-dependent epimerase/dehydratase family protein [Ktedonobacteraceae bacterium]